MLMFHSGLPRSGKSYESVVYHLIPALQRGRKVYARLDGLNYERIAEAAEMPLQRVQDLLIELSEEQVKHLEKQAFDVGSLVILDEAQNYWPDGRKALNPELTKFVAEHGHLGLDILLMGQEFKDVHKLWKNRVSQRVAFRKLDAMGKGNEYVWILYKATDPQKFVEINKGRKKYDEKYFGTYKSFVEGAEGHQLYDDKRASIWSSPVFKKWLPVFGLALVVALGFLWYMFYGGGLLGSAPEVKKSKPVVQAAPAVKQPGQTVPAKVAQVEKPKSDFIGELCEKYRIRITGVMKSKAKMTAIIEWYEGNKLVERLDMVTVARFGYMVTIDDEMRVATLQKGAATFYATQWPLQDFEGRMSNDTLRGISNQSPGPSVVVGSSDGYGILGKAPDGVRKPGA